MKSGANSDFTHGFLRRLRRLLAVVLGLALVAGASYLLAPQWVLRLDTWRRALAADLTSESVQVGDTRWVYYEGGTGPTIVLVHGFGVSKSVWLEIAPLLTPRFHLVIPDLPGWGESTRLAGADYGITAQADRLAGFVDALKLDNFMLVGHSMGGAVAGVYAAAHPHTLAGLVLMDSFGLSFKENAFAKGVLDRDTDPFVFDDRAGYDRVMALSFHQPPKTPGRFKDALVAQNLANRDFINRVFERLRKPSQYRALDSRLGELTMPVLAIWGAQDRIIDPSAIDTLRQGLVHAPSIDTTLIQNCGHTPELEQPAATARVIADFTLRH
ncbi:MAG TPA: alpha/beta fold hydrolase [Rhodanobacteraceae bacterium]|nr:alpha/beta fold hydrolase [Rhodanobacteraceae bacterium]